MLGVCGGHQQIALAFGAPVDLMARLEPGEGYEGAKRERGYFPVETNGNGIFKNLPRKITVWHSHFDEVKQLPKGFRAHRLERELSDPGDAAHAAGPFLVSSFTRNFSTKNIPRAAESLRTSSQFSRVLHQSDRNVEFLIHPAFSNSNYFSSLRQIVQFCPAFGLPLAWTAP